MKMEENMNGE